MSSSLCGTQALVFYNLIMVTITKVGFPAHSKEKIGLLFQKVFNAQKFTPPGCKICWFLLDFSNKDHLTKSCWIKGWINHWNISKTLVIHKLSMKLWLIVCSSWIVLKKQKNTCLNFWKFEIFFKKTYQRIWPKPVGQHHSLPISIKFIITLFQIMGYIHSKTFFICTLLTSVIFQKVHIIHRTVTVCIE